MTKTSSEPVPRHYGTCAGSDHRRDCCL